MQKALEILKKYYGYSSFRPGQWEAISSVLEGKDAVVLMPTGGGKSICYQIPAMLLPGCTIIVSPLIALMVDQVSALQANGIPAVAIHSNQDEYVNREIIIRAIKGDYKIVYISPERLMGEFDAIMAALPISFVAIDEAHCISQWGHDFRPVYTSLRAIKSKLPSVPVMALTATADRLTRGDIASALNLKDPFLWVGSFDRPNLSLSVIPDPGKKQRLKIIGDLIDKYHMDSGIVYCLSRRKTEDMHESLSKMGYRSACYHAGLTPQQRDMAQKAFVNGDIQVICATIAFGMGIDKSNIRWVVHNNIPGNIESYYQEIGRAGRDGLPAETILFYNYADVIMRRNFVEQSGQKEINSEKLDFMQRYAEATVCRRRILLSYFSEESVCDCGNCDNCRSPREKFDGTVLAQKALSAVIRVNANEALNMIIDILRGSNRSEIIKKDYDKIKTYGAGRDIDSRKWHNYILQMIQLGLLEVAYEDMFHLRPTPLGMKVVRGEQQIMLSTYEEPKYAKKQAGDASSERIDISPEEQLLTKLKQLRREISIEENVAAYVIFGDATLLDMVAKRPHDLDAMLDVTGIGVLKAVKYGKLFLPTIRKFDGLKSGIPVGTSQKESLLLYNSGRDPHQIAEIKGINLSTTYGHLVKWVDEDKISDFSRLMTEEEYVVVLSTFEKDPENAYQTLESELKIPSYIARAALARKRFYERNGNPDASKKKSRTKRELTESEQKKKFSTREKQAVAEKDKKATPKKSKATDSEKDKTSSVGKDKTSSTEKDKSISSEKDKTTTSRKRKTKISENDKTLPTERDKAKDAEKDLTKDAEKGKATSSGKDSEQAKPKSKRKENAKTESKRKSKLIGAEEIVLLGRHRDITVDNDKTSSLKGRVDSVSNEEPTHLASQDLESANHGDKDSSSGRDKKYEDPANVEALAKDEASAVHELEISKSADAENHDSEPIEISETILSSETVGFRERIAREEEPIDKKGSAEENGVTADEDTIEEEIHAEEEDNKDNEKPQKEKKKSAFRNLINLIPSLFKKS